MNLKKKMKAFFTLKRRANDGFTLVELIVVIAILAILGGVALPAYSGYVEKANTAADEQLLAALNTAFASACAINGQDHYGRSDTSIKLTGEEGAKSVDAVTVTGIANFDSTLDTFYEGGEFKVFNMLYYAREVGGFVATELPAAYANLLETLMADENFDTNKAALLVSTFMTADGLGTEVLLEQVGQLSGVADVILSAVDDISSSGFASMVWNPDFMNELAVKAGYKDWSEYSETFSEEKLNTILANGAVLSVANNTKNLSTSYLTDTTTNLKDYISGRMDSADTAQEAFAEASLAYGMYMSYAYHTGDQSMIDKANNISDINGLYDILGTLEDEKFITYFNGEQGQKDLEGYKSAMGMINSTTDDEKAVENALLNGFDDPALIALMQQAMSGN